MLRLNLHSHLEGCVRVETAAELGSAVGVPVPDGGWRRAMTMSGVGDLTTFLDSVASVYPLLGTREALRRVAREAVEDAHADGQDYLELRFGPSTHSRTGLPVADVVGAVAQGIREGVDSSGLPVFLIVCLLRHETSDVNQAVTNAACDAAGDVVAGLDLAGDELRYPDLRGYAPMFDQARRAGLGLTAHAGEAAPGEWVRTATEVLGVRRIGHGSRLADDSALLSWAAAEEVCLEVCPSSNVLTGAAPSLRRHPVAAFLDAGCRVALGDDDPVTTGVRLMRETELLTTELRRPASDLGGIARASVAAAFCDDATRAQLAARLPQTAGS